MDQLRTTLVSFGVDWPKFFTTLVNFCVVLFLLHRFAYKPLLQVLDERRRRIEDSLKDSERIKEELAQAETRRQQILDQAEAKAEKMIEEARQGAQRVTEKKIHEASVQAEEIVRKAHAAAVLDRDKQFAELKKQIGYLVVDTTSRVVGKVITPEDEKRLQEETAKAVNA